MMGDQAAGKLSPFLRRQRAAAAAAFIEGRVLDYGCGTGAMASLVEAGRYTGIDSDRESLEIAGREHPEHSFHLPDELPGPGEAFTTILLLAVIEHIEDRPGLLRNLGRMLAPGGRIVITTPRPLAGPIHLAGAKLGLFSLEAGEEHGHLIGKREMARLAAEAGFTVKLYRSFLLGLNQLFILEQ